MEFLSIFVTPIANAAVITGIIIAVVFAFVLLALSFKLVQQTKAVIVERLGAYHKTLGVGLHFIIPVFDRVIKTVSMKEQVKDFDPQPVITRDNVTMQIDTVVFFQITDPKLYTYGTENPIMAIENISATTLRNIIGDLDLDQTLTSRDLINTKMREILDEATDPWGIKVNRVEVKNIVPPKDIRDSMEKQMRAEREKRAQILQAEGEKRAQILNAEGEYEAVVLRAEASKKQRVLNAEGEATAILRVKEAGADQAVLTLKSLEALALVANGQATKIVVPTNITDIASTVLMAAEIAKDNLKK